MKTSLNKSNSRNEMKKITTITFSLLLLMPLLVLQAADKALSEMGVAGNYAFETSAFMKETAHAAHAAPPVDWQTRSGALRLNVNWETNKSLTWFIEDQQLGGEYVAAGVALGNPDEIRWGLKVIEWGFAQMETNGLFNHHDCYHSASFFIESTAHGLLLLEASPWHAEFADQVNTLKSKLLTAARWMVQPDIHDKNWPDTNKFPKLTGERRYGHRRYLDAAALGEAGVLCRDRELIGKSVWFIREGIAFQRADGVNTEKGGSDHHYQALGLMYACRYYQIVAEDAVRVEMRPMLDKGFAWLLARVKPDGSVDAADNARTGFGQEKARNGKPKGLEYRFASLSLGHWSQLTQNAALEITARRVFEADQSMRKRGVEMTWDGY